MCVSSHQHALEYTLPALGLLQPLPMCFIKAIRSIRAGDELFCDYGRQTCEIIGVPYDHPAYHVPKPKYKAGYNPFLFMRSKSLQVVCIVMQHRHLDQCPLNRGKIHHSWGLGRWCRGRLSGRCDRWSMAQTHVFKDGCLVAQKATQDVLN